MRILIYSAVWWKCQLKNVCEYNFFDVFENCLTMEERKAEKPYYEIVNQMHGPYKELDYMWRLDDGTLVRYEDVQKLKPWFSGIEVLKAKCSACGKEILLFDNRTCGYDALTGEHTDAYMAYTPHFKPKGNSSLKIELTFENDSSLDAFKEATGMDCTEEFYSNAFSWIQIYGISDEGKRKKLLDEETA